MQVVEVYLWCVLGYYLCAVMQQCIVIVILMQMYEAALKQIVDKTYEDSFPYQPTTDY